MHYGICSNCGAEGLVEKHHVFFKSKAMALKNCELNLVDLCQDCHRGTYGVHGTKGHKLDIKLKKFVQTELKKVIQENDIDDKETTFQGIARVLGIKEKDVQVACKLVRPIEEDTYYTNEIIRALQGGEMYE